MGRETAAQAPQRGHAPQCCSGRNLLGQTLCIKTATPSPATHTTSRAQRARRAWLIARCPCGAAGSWRQRLAGRARRRTVDPVDLEVLCEEGRRDHAHALLHPARQPQLTHAWGRGPGGAWLEGARRRRCWWVGTAGACGVRRAARPCPGGAPAVSRRAPPRGRRAARRHGPVRCAGCRNAPGAAHTCVHQGKARYAALPRPQAPRCLWAARPLHVPARRGEEGLRAARPPRR